MDKQWKNCSEVTDERCVYSENRSVLVQSVQSLREQ